MFRLKVLNEGGRGEAKPATVFAYPSGRRSRRFPFSSHETGLGETMPYFTQRDFLLVNLQRTQNQPKPSTMDHVSYDTWSSRCDTNRVAVLEV